MNNTGENIKRRRFQRRRKRVKMLLALIIFGLLAAVIVWTAWQAYSWASQTYRTYYASFKDYEHRREERRLPGDKGFEGYTNVLVIGLDEGIPGPGMPEAAGGPVHYADALMLLSVDNTSGAVRILSIPRGTLVTLPNQKMPQRINTLYEASGAPFVTRTVSGLLGVSVHQYVVIDTKVLTEVVDLLGGIDIYVEADMNYEDPEARLSIHIDKGFQHLDGETALKYLRFRSDELGDIGRIRRQQHFARAFYKRILSFDTVKNVAALAEIIKKRVTTSAELYDSAHLLSLIKGLSGEAPQAVVIPGAHPAGKEVLWEVNREELAATIAGLFPEKKDKDK